MRLLRGRRPTPEEFSSHTKAKRNSYGLNVLRNPLPCVCGPCEEGFQSHPGFGGFSWMRWAICTVHPGFATFSWMSIRGAGVVGCFAMVEAHGPAAPAAPRGGLPTCAFPHFAVRHVKRQNAKKCKFIDGPSATQKPYRDNSGRSSHARREGGGIYLSATLLPG